MCLLRYQITFMYVHLKLKHEETITCLKQHILRSFLAMYILTVYSGSERLALAAGLRHAGQSG